MRNLKKIFAVIMTVALIASMMVPALAAGFTYESEATKLNNIGLMSGMNLGDKVTRIQGLTFAIKAAGKSAEAMALTTAEVDAALADVVDADKIPAWGRNYAAYAVKNGFTSGVDASLAPKVKFAPEQTVSATAFLFWTLKIGMGYADVGTNNAVAKAVEAKVITLSQALAMGPKAELIRDDVAGILFGAASTGVNKDGKTFIKSLIDAGFVTQAKAFENGFGTAPAALTLGVESVTAINAKQLVVVFNKEVDKDSAEDKLFYEVKDKGDTVKAIQGVKLAADKKTATINLSDDVAVFLSNNTTAKVTVKKDLKDATGVKLAADVVFDKVAVGDTTFPTFNKVEAVGLKTLRLYFNEPVKGYTTAGAFSVKAGSYTWTVTGVKANNTDYYVELTLGTNLIEGNVDVKVTNAVTDYAGLMVFDKTITYAFAKVTSAPTVTIDSVKPGELKLKFDRPVYGEIRVAHSVKVDYYMVSSGAIAEMNATDSITYNFSGKKIPAGNITFYIYNEGDVKDLYGNKFVATTLTATVVADTAAPVISSFKDNDGASVAVTFDEAVQTVEKTNVELKKADGTVTIIASANLDATEKILTITPSTGKLSDNTDYVLTIKKVKDKEGNEATNLTQSFKTGDNTEPKITRDDCYYVAKDGKIYLVFSEAMNEAAMTNKANYKVNGAALGDKDTVTKFNEKTVLIDMDAALTADPTVVISTAVTDLAGKKFVTTDLQVTVATIPADTLKIDSVELIAKDKIKIKFTKDLAQFASADISVYTATKTVTIAAVESVSGKEVVVKTQDSLNTDGTFGTGNEAVTLAAVASPENTKSNIGTVLSDAATKDVTASEKVAPAVVTDKINDVDTPRVTIVIAATNDLVAKDVTGTITIAYTEDMKDQISPLAFKVAGYDVTSIDVDNVDPTLVKIDVKCKENDTTNKPVVSQVQDISDDNGNVLAYGGTYTVK